MSEVNQPIPDNCGPLDCKVVIEQLWEFLDGELDAERAQLVHQHLTLCQHCYPHYDFEKAFLEALSDCNCSTCAPNDLRCRVLDALRSAGFSATA
jgi:anti-sigma factor (TIGR02949 family)